MGYGLGKGCWITTARTVTAKTRKIVLVTHISHSYIRHYDERHSNTKSSFVTHNPFDHLLRQYDVLSEWFKSVCFFLEVICSILGESKNLYTFVFTLDEVDERYEITIA